MACTFTDLKAWLANGGPIEPEESDGYEKVAKNIRKGKRKEKEMEKEKGKGEKEKETENKRDRKRKNTGKRAK